MAAMPPDRIGTARLVLRRPRPSDAGAIFEDYARDTEVLRYLAWRPHEDVSDTLGFLAAREAAWERGEVHAYVAALKVDDRPVGMIELQPCGHKVAFGYVLGRAWWGRGYMPEALSALVGWSLAQPDIWRAWAFCDVENRASARVMEKAGMRFEGVLRRWSVHPNLGPEPRDCLSYALTR
jgi:[ribosomal protein S5]-alanine N-acetyltransferase